MPVEMKSIEEQLIEANVRIRHLESSTNFYDRVVFACLVAEIVQFATILWLLIR